MLASGATSHFVNERKMLKKFIEEKLSIKLADNSETISEGYGNMYWKTLDKSGKEITIKLRKVYFVPNLHQNILSLSAIFIQFPTASEINRDKKNLILKIRTNITEIKIEENLFKNIPDKKQDKIFSTNVKAMKTTISEENFMTEHIKMADLNSQNLAI